MKLHSGASAFTGESAVFFGCSFSHGIMRWNESQDLSNNGASTLLGFNVSSASISQRQFLSLPMTYSWSPLPEAVEAKVRIPEKVKSGLILAHFGGREAHLPEFPSHSEVTLVNVGHNWCHTVSLSHKYASCQWINFLLFQSWVVISCPWRKIEVKYFNFSETYMLAFLFPNLCIHLPFSLLVYSFVLRS